MMKEMEQSKQEAKILKKELKAWEHQFESVYGRKPDKSDIAAVPEITKKYKLYAKLKSTAASNTELNDTKEAIPEKKPVKPTSPPPARKQAQENQNARVEQKSKDNLEENGDAVVPTSEPNTALRQSRRKAAQKKNVDIETPEEAQTRQLPEAESINVSPVNEASSVPSEETFQVEDVMKPVQEIKTQAFKSRIASGPMATSNLGQGMNKFRARILAQQQQLNNQASVPNEKEVGLDDPDLATYKEAANLAHKNLPQLRSSGELIHDVDLQDFAERKKKMVHLGEQQDQIHEIAIPSQRSSKTSSNESYLNDLDQSSRSLSASKPAPIMIDTMTTIRVKGESESDAQIIPKKSKKTDSPKKKSSIKNAGSTIVGENAEGKSESDPKIKSTPELSIKNSDNELAHRDATKRVGWDLGDSKSLEAVNQTSSQDLHEQYKTAPSPKTPEVKADDDLQIIPSNSSDPSHTGVDGSPHTEVDKPERKKLAQNPLDPHIFNANTPVPKSPVESAVSKLGSLPSISTKNFFVRLPEDGVLRCRIYRKKNLLDKANPTYLLHNDIEDKFMLAAKKKLMSKSIHYMISDSESDISKDSLHLMAKLKANYKRTTFILSDARTSREIVCVNYTRNVLPRELQVAVTAPNIEEQDASKNIVDDFRLRSDKLYVMKNKPPRWNETTQSHCLNFGGRVTQPSIKNMQLIPENDEGRIVLQFGRCGPDLFALDARWPLTPIEAFGIALSTFDAYDSS